jgi:hypothetical protein
VTRRLGHGADHARIVSNASRVAAAFSLEALQESDRLSCLFKGLAALNDAIDAKHTQIPRHRSDINVKRQIEVGHERRNPSDVERWFRSGHGTCFDRFTLRR